MDFSALASFNSVASYGGFGHASRATGQSKATLSRHVRELKEKLGVRLIERGQQSLRLTEEGAALHARTDGLIGEIKEAGHSIGGGLSQPRGRLRVSTTVSFAHVAMGRIAAAFVAHHPEVELEVVGDDRLVDPVAEGFDVVIRIDPHPEHGLVGHCFLRGQMLVVAPPRLAALVAQGDQNGPIAVPAVVLASAGGISEWRASQDGCSLILHPRPVLRLSSPLMVRDAVRAGAGAALLPQSMVTEDLASGRLVTWGAVSDRKVEVWVLHTARRLVSPKVSVFVQMMRAAYAEGTVR